MFLVDDATIRAVQAAQARGGDLAAVVELRERFPGITSNAAALGAVRMVLAMRPDDGEITARVAAVRAEWRRAKPRVPKGEALVIWK